MARKKKPVKGKSLRKKPAKAAPKPAAKKAAPVKPEAKPAQKLLVTAQLRRIWLRVRNAYSMSSGAFSNALSLLSDDEADLLYNLVRFSLYKEGPAQMIKEHPEMREFVKTNVDRLCMHDIYEILSWRLGRREPMPKDRAIVTKFRRAVKGTLI